MRVELRDRETAVVIGGPTCPGCTIDITGQTTHVGLSIGCILAAGWAQRGRVRLAPCACADNITAVDARHVRACVQVRLVNVPAIDTP